MRRHGDALIALNLHGGKKKGWVLLAIYVAAHHIQMLWICFPCECSPNSPQLSHPHSGRTIGLWLEVTEGHTLVRCCCSPRRTLASPQLGAIGPLCAKKHTQTRNVTQSGVQVRGQKIKRPNPLTSTNTHLPRPPRHSQSDKCKQPQATAL